MSWPEKKRGRRHGVSRSNPAEPCPSCGQRVARSRLREHFLEAECLLAEVDLHFRELGWDLALERHRPLVLAALGIDPDAELADVRADPRASGKMAWAPCCVVYPEAGTRRLRARRRAEPRYPGAPTLGYGWRVERGLLACARLLDNLGGGTLSHRARQAAARRAYLDPDWADALRAARALGGAEAGRRMVRELERGFVRRGGEWVLGAQVSAEDADG